MPPKEECVPPPPSSTHWPFDSRLAYSHDLAHFPPPTFQPLSRTCGRNSAFLQTRSRPTSIERHSHGSLTATRPREKLGSSQCSPRNESCDSPMTRTTMLSNRSHTSSGPLSPRIHSHSPRPQPSPDLWRVSTWQIRRGATVMRNSPSQTHTRYSLTQGGYH